VGLSTEWPQRTGRFAQRLTEHLALDRSLRLGQAPDIGQRETVLELSGVCRRRRRGRRPLTICGAIRCWSRKHALQ
jgi:hypothetical protein